MAARAKVVFRWLMACAMVAVGISHFVEPQPFVDIVPAGLPSPLALVYVSGAFEVLGGIGILPVRTRRPAGIGIIALLLAVFPANINMALNDLPMNGEPVPPALLWARLPLQLVFIAWAWWVTKPDESATPPSSSPSANTRVAD